MPDLNLVDDESSLEGSAETPEETPAPPSRRRGEGFRVVIILVALAILGGVVYMLNQLGIVKLWGEREPVVATYEEPAVQAPAGETPADQPPSQQQAATQAQQPPAQQPQKPAQQPAVKLVETPPIEPSKQPAPVQPPTRKAEEPTKRTAPDVSTMHGAYTVQVSSWRDRATAETMVQRLKDAGYPAFVEPVQAKGMEWFAVRVGRYPSVAEAKKAVDGFALELRMRHFISRTAMQ